MSESTNSTPVFKEEYQKQIADIYKQYQQTVKPYVAQLEVMENEFPIEILNEVRAIMSHIAKCYEITNEELIQKNIGKAKSHMKRCVLDCYKYLCLAYSDYYENFVHKYYSNDIEVISARSQELKCDAVKIIKRINNCDFNEIIFIDDIKENIIRFNNMGINAYTPEEWEQLI